MSEAIAMLTNKTFLLRKNGSTWENFIDITKYPQFFGQPEAVDVTRLRDTKHRNINGLLAADSLDFEANYLLAAFKKLTADDVTKNVNTYCLCFGDMRGTDGRFEWSGKVAARILEGEPGAARKMAFTISDEGEQELHEVDALTTDPTDTATTVTAE